VLAVGQSSRELATFVSQATEALARRLSIEARTFPGDHIGCVLHPRAFSSRLLAAVNEFGSNL
jgi:predicted metalloenzyme YecM